MCPYLSVDDVHIEQFFFLFFFCSFVFNTMSFFVPINMAQVHSVKGLLNGPDIHVP